MPRGGHDWPLSSTGLDPRGRTSGERMEASPERISRHYSRPSLPCVLEDLSETLMLSVEAVSVIEDIIYLRPAGPTCATAGRKRLKHLARSSLITGCN